LITDSDLVDRIVQVDGEHFRSQDATRNERGGDYATGGALRAYQEFQRELEAIADEIEDPSIYTREVLDAVIYGTDGWHRYLVTGDGRVWFSKHHGQRNVEKARTAGFDVW
jgi:hypothetical protein